MATAASRKGVLNCFKRSSSEVQWYFSQVPRLLPGFPYEVALAYVFLRAEEAHNRALYCGVVKLLRGDAVLVDIAVNKHHLTREGFRELFCRIFGHQVPSDAAAKMAKAEETRDKCIHGKDAPEPELRQAIVDVLEYADAMNVFIFGIAGFKPFGSLQGFKGRGRGEALDRTATRWLLKGLGFDIA